MNKTTLAGLALTSVLASVTSTHGQQTEIQQLERTRTIQRQQRGQIEEALQLQPGATAPEVYPGEEEDVGPQRILRVERGRKHFDIFADSQYFWTSNPLLVEDPPEASTLFVNSVQFALAPDPYALWGREFAPKIGMRGQWFNYGLDGGNNDLGAFDFHAQTAFTEFGYSIWNNWKATVGLDVTRLLNQSDYHEIYKEFMPYWGLQRTFSFDNNKLLVAGYRGTYHFTEVSSAPRDINDRTDHILGLSYTQELIPKLMVQPFYMFQYTYYNSAASRNEFINTAGISLTYYFTKDLSARIFFSYDNKNSDEDQFANDYEKFDTGGGATLSFRF